MLGCPQHFMLGVHPSPTGFFLATIPLKTMMVKAHSSVWRLTYTRPSLASHARIKSGAPGVIKAPTISQAKNIPRARRDGLILRILAMYPGMPCFKNASTLQFSTQSCSHVSYFSCHCRCASVVGIGCPQMSGKGIKGEMVGLTCLLFWQFCFNRQNPRLMWMVQWWRIQGAEGSDQGSQWRWGISPPLDARCPNATLSQRQTTEGEERAVSGCRAIAAARAPTWWGSHSSLWSCTVIFVALWC